MTTLGLRRGYWRAGASQRQSSRGERSRTIRCGCDVGALWAEPPNSPALSEEFGVKTAFVWQPIPFYRYDLAYHPFRDTVPIWRSPGHVPATAKSKHCTRHSMGDDFVWCAGIQDGVKEQPPTDSVHYTNPMNRRVAQCILDGLPDGIRHILTRSCPDRLRKRSASPKFVSGNA